MCTRVESTELNRGREVELLVISKKSRVVGNKLLCGRCMVRGYYAYKHCS